MRSAADTSITSQRLSCAPIPIEAFPMRVVTCRPTASSSTTPPWSPTISIQSPIAALRVEALYQFNDDWSALIAQSYQNMEADGVFAETAADSLGKPQPDLTVQLYNPSYDKDRFENTALTIEGRVGALKLVYAGAYLVRNVEQVQDYTAYAHSGFYVDYYQCVNPGPTPAAAKCFTPSSTWRDVERNTHLSQELRLSTPGDWRIRAVGGLFYENYQIQDQGDWFYLTALPYFNPVAPPTGYFMRINGQRGLRL